METYGLLIRNQGERGAFGHLSRSKSISGMVRGGVGSFADQVYPIYAMSKFAMASSMLKSTYPFGKGSEDESISVVSLDNQQNPFLAQGDYSNPTNGAAQLNPAGSAAAVFQILASRSSQWKS